jgi:peptide/nickel transport system ATP-binding protein
MSHFMKAPTVAIDRTSLIPSFSVSTSSGRKPAFVVADEPVSALDMTIQKQILELLASMEERNGFACLFISHDLGAVSQIADRILVMNAGRIIEEGSVPQIMDNPQHDYPRQLVEASPTIEDFKTRTLTISA